MLLQRVGSGEMCTGQRRPPLPSARIHYASGWERFRGPRTRARRSCQFPPFVCSWWTASSRRLFGGNYSFTSFRPRILGSILSSSLVFTASPRIYEFFIDRVRFANRVNVSVVRGFERISHVCNDEGNGSLPDFEFTRTYPLLLTGLNNCSLRWWHKCWCHQHTGL